MVRVSNKRRPPRRPITHEDAWKKIEDVGSTLINKKCLRHTKDKRAIDLSLSEVPRSDKDRRFQNFINTVRLRCRPNSATGVLLCSTALGKDNMASMNKYHREELFNKLERERNGPLLNSPVLKEISRLHQIPDMQIETDQPPLPEHNNHSNIDGATFEHASLEGIATVFTEDLCSIILRVPCQIDGETIWKAAVTTAFPLWGGLVNCLMSLDICMPGIDYLAMALFDARITPAEPLRHISFGDGPTLVVPNSESTMKGVKEGAIIKVFGAEIHEAIRDSPVRKKELGEGKQLTECVSMIITRQGAIINLSLDLNRGVEISRKLYA
ncbi:uncharacterized protein BDW43DRAFT_234368 [Aspergillus alliaceus]|uniref:uncharacterized protein n=1 Tax=Petromyces alliaceus TaxID=209559 RepID=UPI0012A728FD|nr:uncharacterized protein BDW43DRAFT_234368 [Aspergillus alliaceus]KAB8227907.1 hypothetical protein BDW43DRAFT_234368 [Aspergillus alliaceus]